MPTFRGQGEHNDRTASRNGRNRRPISCLPCRGRKLRCDRALPACGNCVNRGDITACCYVPRKSETRTKPQEPSSLSGAAQARIDHLESLVLTLLKNDQQRQRQVETPSSCIEVENDGNDDEGDIENNGSESHGDTESSDKQMTTSITRSHPAINIGADHKQSLSVDDGHWALLLNEISEVRSHIRAQQKEYKDQTKKISHLLRRSSENPGPTLLFGSTGNASRSEILSQLPSRYSSDIIVTRFFSHMYPAIYVLHGPTFYKQYEQFWLDQSKTSTAWIALLFAILRIAMLDYLREGDEPLEYQGKCHDLASTYRNRFTDCLVLADYTQPQEFLIEALIMHQYGEYVASRDAKSSVWVLGGMIVRLAMRMGYHQESQPTLPSTPFQAEMRRRAWAFIRQCDILISFQMGLPSMISPRLLEMPLPRNIHDDDSFHEACPTLPPALPDSEPTQISYLIAKTKLAFGFARALEEINRADAMQWERVLEIDRELRHIYDNVPDYYKIGQLSSEDSLVLVSCRFVLSSIHHKSLCVVHSRFLEIAKSDYRFIYSRRVCLTSAMSMLRFQAIQNQDIPVDGSLRSLTNYQTSLAIHDYLLAATIITADLCSSAADNTTNQQPLHGVPTRSEMVKALSLSARIFGQMRDQSMEAYKAADVLEMLVKRFEGEDQNSARSPKELQRAPAGQLPASRSNAMKPAFVSSSRQTSLSGSLNVINKSPASDFSTGINLDFAHDKNTQLSSRGTSRLSQSIQPEGQIPKRTGMVEATNLDALTTWPDPQEGSFGTQSTFLPQIFPEFEGSANWMTPERPDVSAQSIMETSTSSGGPVSATANTITYSAALALTDPMSTLWNLSSGAQGGFQMN